MIEAVFDQPGAGFVLLPVGQKFPPLGKGWQNHPHTFTEATAHNGNVGVLAGNGYIGLDQDDPTAFDGLELPSTTTWETRPGRLGMWFSCEDVQEGLTLIGKKSNLAQIALFKDGEHVGEIKLQRTYQVAPPGWKVLEGGIRADYKLLQPIPPAPITLDLLLSELMRIGITFSSKPEQTTAEPADPHTNTGFKKVVGKNYAPSALAEECDTIRKTPVGNRNNQLNISAIKIFGLVRPGALEKEKAWDDLEEAGLSTGLQRDEVEATLQSAWKASEARLVEVVDDLKNDQIDPAIQEKALAIAQSGDPLDFMLDTFNQSHVGDRLLGEAQFVAFGLQSALNAKGIFETWSGSSGKGKSDAAKACIRQLPPEYVLSGSVTPKSLYHHAKELLDAGVLFLDDKNVEAGSDLEETLKRIQTDFRSCMEFIELAL
jgi:hypothetical protein